MSTKILLVDHSDANQLTVKNMLNDYELFTAYNGQEAMDLLDQDKSIEIMLLELNMPVMNGFEVLEKLRMYPDRYDVSTIILTNSEESENEIRGLELGAVDYIRKPLQQQSLRKRIEIHTRLRLTGKVLAKHKALLEETIQKRTEELIITRNITISALVKLLEIRNIESGNHVLRIQEIMKALCEHLSKKEKYRAILTPDYINELYETAPLHDIGKFGIPDAILLKPGKLNLDEFEIMKQHTAYGVEALKYDYDNKGSFSFLKTAISIIGEHHERYDGTGYPKGLQGEEISLAGRLMAIIDVYDALISNRVYKPPFDHALALQVMKDGKGTQFDPDLLDGFFEISDTVYMIKTKTSTY